eukprot:TRINITY_DN7656_c0_g1_i1.p1 TRINITY_DN7656_c0_g1~~TRINITY_DN7656_c0_g1_i1.p1  ORF type:complete len:114 (+),score=13.81 TRINITY_DN7656_c0_g1_i1:76-417(+)
MISLRRTWFGCCVYFYEGENSFHPPTHPPIQPSIHPPTDGTTCRRCGGQCCLRWSNGEAKSFSCCEPTDDDVDAALTVAWKAMFFPYSIHVNAMERRRRSSTHRPTHIMYNCI